MKRLKLNKSLCIGCTLCALACSAHKEGEFNPSKSRINIESYYDKGALGYKEHFCILCGLCVKACPMDAISITDDHIQVDFDKCSGCGECLNKCPKKCIKIIKEKALICDTCNGDPKCVKNCPHDALVFE